MNNPNEQRTVDFGCGCRVFVFPNTRSTRLERCDEHKKDERSRDELIAELSRKATK